MFLPGESTAQVFSLITAKDGTDGKQKKSLQVIQMCKNSFTVSLMSTAFRKYMPVGRYKHVRNYVQKETFNWCLEQLVSLDFFKIS